MVVIANATKYRIEKQIGLKIYIYHALNAVETSKAPTRSASGVTGVTTMDQ